jgi:hypothetical protein
MTEEKSMATGLEIYDALKRLRHPHSSTVKINQLDATDLEKLTPGDLASRGFDVEVAEEVSVSLSEGKLDLLGERMGLKLEIDPDAPCLIQENCLPT